MTTRHPYFDLTLHDDAELAAALGSAVVARETLTEWPLSCVQRIRTADGRTRIYKAQAEPTIEPQFYAAARSPALPIVIPLPNPPGPPALLMEEVTASRLSDLRIAPTDAPHFVNPVLDTIAAIRGDLPVTADLTTRAGYEAYIGTTLDDLAALVDSGAFKQVDTESVATVARTATACRRAVSQPGYVHGDLRAENIFVHDACQGGIRFTVIDWQRPLRGPSGLDSACLLESLGSDPLPIVGPKIIALLALTRIAWLAACARRWFPPGVPHYDGQIAALVESLRVV